MIHFYVNVQDRSQAAFEEARRFYEAYHVGTFPEDYLRWRLVTGTPAEVTERLAGFLDAGCTLPILRFASWDPMAQMRRAMATVLPALRDHAARRPRARRLTGRLSPRRARSRCILALRSLD